jgi:hypothetical protein
MPLTDERILQRMGTNPDSLIKFSAGSIDALLMCLSIVENTEQSLPGHLGFVQTFATGPISQTAGMVTVGESRHPPLQLKQYGSYHHKPYFSIEITCTVPTSTIKQDVQVPPLTPWPDHK